MYFHDNIVYTNMYTQCHSNKNIAINMRLSSHKMSKSILSLFSWTQIH